MQLHTRYRTTGGEDSVVRAESNVLRDAGHEVRLHLERNPEDSVRSAAALAAAAWNIRSARRVARAIDEFRPDVAHIHNTWFAASPSVLAPFRARRIPITMTIHNYRLACANSYFMRDGSPCEDCLDHSPWRAVRHACYRDSRALSAVAAGSIAIHRGLRTWGRRVDRFTVLSEFARTRLARAGLPTDRMRLGSNFVPDPGPRPTPPSTSSTLLFVGRISAEKGLAVLLEAWRRARIGEARLVVVGDGPDRGRLQRDAPPGVEFLGSRPAEQVMAHMQRARALVLPSLWYEGQPMTALEGLAAGTPLVLSRIGGLPEVLGTAEAGWLVPPGHPDGLSDVLAGIVRDDDLVDRRGRGARDRYLDRFNPAAALARLESLYSDLPGHPQR